MTGEVLAGINNIYTVRPLEDRVDEPRLMLCRIRGKVLRAGEREHNPITAGDLVALEPNAQTEDEAWITERMPRRSALLRYNKNSRSPQAIAANVDLLVCVSSAREPPFRPRFLDRLLVSGHAGGIRPLVFVNKCDLPIDAEAEARLRDYERIGSTVIRGSARTGAGLAELRPILAGRTSVFSGQSGVGKSSLLNRLDPALRLKVGSLSIKHDRGSHTTNFAALVTLEDGARVIDTPGIRELDVHDMPPVQLRHFYPEFEEPARSCDFASCTHTGERGCAVERAVAAGRIHPDRYESYARTFADLVAFEGNRYG